MSVASAILVRGHLFSHPRPVVSHSFHAILYRYPGYSRRVSDRSQRRSCSSFLPLRSATVFRGPICARLPAHPACSGLGGSDLCIEMGMQNHSRFKPGGVIFARNFQFFFRIGVFLAGKDADKRRKLDSVCFDPVINTMVLSIYL